MGHKFFHTFIAVGRWLVQIAPKVGFGLLVLFVLLAIPWTYFNIKWGRELEAELAALKAQGMPLTPAEVAPKPVPDDQNAAVLYQEVFKVHFPPSREPTLEPGMAGLSREQLSLLADYRKKPNRELEKQVRELLTRPEVQDALETFRRGSRRPYCVFPVNWQDGAAALFPHLSKFRDASRIVAAHALVLAKDGHVEEALDWCQVALRMSPHAASDPTLIGQLVAIAVQAITFDAVKQIVSAADIPPATADRFERHLRQIDLYKTFTAAMIGERGFTRSIFDDLNEEPYEVYRSMGLRLHGFDALPLRLYFSWLARPLHKLDQLAYLKHMGQTIEIQKLPYREGAPRLRVLDENTYGLPSYLFITRMLTPVFIRVSGKRDQGIVNIGLCRVVLALKAYKYERGAYPDTLERLQQTLDWQLPEDPFSGQDFAYRRQGEGFVLYSVGEDLEDDGGLPERDERGKWRDDADIVWECVR